MFNWSVWCIDLLKGFFFFFNCSNSSTAPKYRSMNIVFIDRCCFDLFIRNSASLFSWELSCVCASAFPRIFLLIATILSYNISFYTIPSLFAMFCFAFTNLTPRQYRSLIHACGNVYVATVVIFQVMLSSLFFSVFPLHDFFHFILRLFALFVVSLWCDFTYFYVFHVVRTKAFMTVCLCFGFTLNAIVCRMRACISCKWVPKWKE